MRRQLMPLLATLAAVGCMPLVTGAPCSNDSNCPAEQRCVAQVCQAGGGEGTGGGATGGGGGAMGGGGGTSTGGGGGAVTGGGGGAVTGGGGGAVTGGGGGAVTGGGGGSVTGGGGGSVTGGGGGSVTGGGGGTPADTDPPLIVQTTPTTASTNVSRSTTIQFVFSEPMNPTSVFNTFSPTITFAGTVWGNGNTVLTLVPNAPLNLSTTYSVMVIGNDAAGNSISPPYNYTFTTEAASDMTAPTVLTTTPTGGSSGVPTASGFLITFSEPMNPGSVQVTSTPSLVLTAPSWAANNTELSIGPVNPMAPSTMHTVTLTGTDVAGNALAVNTTFAFTTAAPPDTTPPTLVSSVPVNRSSDVPVTTRLSLTFSEPMNTALLAVDASPDPGLGTPTWSNGDRTVSFATPMSDWPTGANVVVSIDGRDVAGNSTGRLSLSFLTAAPPDMMRPTVNSTAPSGGTTNVPVSTNLEFNFSEPMQQTATQNAFSSSPAITCSFTWNSNDTLMVCNPSVNMIASTTYNITLGTGARDVIGNQLAAAFPLSFTTAAAPDTTRPTVTTTVPANGAAGVPRSVFALPPSFPSPSPIRITFSEAMSQSAVQGAFSITSPTGFNGGTFSWSGNTMTYVPPSFFDNGQLVTFTIGTGATDLAGNGLLNAYNGNFRIKRRSTTNFTNVSTSAALDGYLYGSSSCGSVIAAPNSSIAVSGDSSANVIYRGFLTFSIAPLASLVNLDIISATLTTFQSNCVGSPFSSTFGSSIEAWHVDYGGSLEAADCNTANLGARQYTLSSSLSEVFKSVSVRAAVEDDYVNRVARSNRSQFMLRTATLATDNDSASDYCSQSTYNASTTANRPYLQITYEYD